MTGSAGAGCRGDTSRFRMEGVDGVGGDDLLSADTDFMPGMLCSHTGLSPVRGGVLGGWELATCTACVSLTSHYQQEKHPGHVQVEWLHSPNLLRSLVTLNVC
ncbi:unnamed protein product [Pleuronectes platessa]|uniref:Uncharacterized protein n=1 Tax=Pleuronectes platessa TaxID=8262 RepID=A0A9N7ZCE8_PLEPL|nr:unnamed protein product [Pleuronectes platessa]